MLYFCLAVSAGLSLFAFLVVLLHRVVLTLVAMLYGALGLVLLALSPVLGMHCLGLALAALLALALWRRRAFLVLATVATVAVYGIAFRDAAEHERAVMSSHPAVAMADRLLHAPTTGPLTATAARDLGHLEDEVERDFRETSGTRREYRRALEALHGRTRYAFVNSPGFGATRMPQTQERQLLHLRQRLAEEEQWTEPLPTPGSPPAWSPGDVPADPPDWLDDAKAATALERHRKLTRDFANAPGFGVVIDRLAAGFEPHRVREYPQVRIDDLDLRGIELVGLVVGPTPRVYVSKHLPRMDELLEAPTRDLDGFEQAGLQTLRIGETLFVREVDGTVRMLGAIRSAKQCVACHGGERGDLLGAFSYALKRQ